MGFDSNEALIEKCKAGDLRSQYLLYKSYSKAMYNICIRMVPNVEDAEDLLQESFMAAFRNIKKYRKESTFGTWLRRIVINKCISFIRKKKINFLYPESEKLPAFEDHEPVDLMQSIPLESIHQSIKELPDGARIILNMFLLEGYKHREIASLLNISESTSKSQYHRARLLLKDKILKKIDE